MNKTTIEWTDYTWNPVTGCDKVSAGCRSCYAETVATRFWGGRKFTDVKMHEDRLDEPAKNKKKWAGKKVFVCSMSDLFHEDVSFSFIYDVFVKMYNQADTIFQILTKRPARAIEFYKYAELIEPLKNIWIGVSCENQEQANIRIPLLLQIPAAVRFLSCEPLIGPIDISSWFYPSEFIGMEVESHDGQRHDTLKNDIHWLIAGGESGHNARPMHPDWVRSLRDQCATANVPFFFKQWGQWSPDSHVNYNGPFFIRSKKHFIIDIDGRGHLYRDMFDVDDEALKRENELNITKDNNAWWMANTGKSKSGNLLDGVQHLNFPVV